MFLFPLRKIHTHIFTLVSLIWWDEWHPTTKVHKALAEKTVEALSLWE
jgi:phospholipase/lecithinase/hemolysin